MSSRTHSTDSTVWMCAEACELMGQADRLQRQFFRPVASPAPPVAWEPPADIYEDEREIVVVIAMPGVTAERMQVDSEPGVLIVRGSRPLPLVGPGHAVRRLEIPHGHFERCIALPPGRMELGTPEVLHGCLTPNVHVPAGATPKDGPSAGSRCSSRGRRCSPHVRCAAMSR